jgi:hypothetical protein
MALADWTQWRWRRPKTESGVQLTLLQSCALSGGLAAVSDGAFRQSAQPQLSRALLCCDRQQILRGRLVPVGALEVPDELSDHELVLPPM